MTDSAAEYRGKIDALAPSFTLLSEITGRAPTESTMGLYAQHFADQHLAINDVNRAVAAMLTSWQHPYWPSPEVIAVRAREIARQDRATDSALYDRSTELEEVAARAAAERWERQVTEANAWREAHPQEFQGVVRRIDAEIAALIATGRHHHLTTNALYRDAYREGAVVGACLRELGILEARARTSK